MLPTIDIHIHVAARDRADCRLAESLLASPAFAYMLVANRVRPSQLRKDFDGTIRRRVVAALQGARSVDRGVVLALDAIYREDGTRCWDESGMVVSNDYVMELVRSTDKALFGASVHPNRGEREGRAELERCLEGPPPAALVKWIPNSQLIDPSQPRHDWFYKVLAASGVPLLCHCGPEYAVPVPAPQAQHQRLGDPRRLRRALELGVTVIVAHAATRFFPTDAEDYLAELGQMMQEFPSLFADVSAFCTLCRLGTARRVLDTLPPDRLVLGSDFPIPVTDLPPLLAEGLSVAEHLEIVALKNPLDKNLRQLLAMGFPASVATKAAELLSPRALAA
ncbi:MAG: amidohydrolase family protein [Thermoanaerobaculaceae bacterium]|nr:amidohydrolase family protein [Thermoanaerobaculaceae bacterium]